MPIIRIEALGDPNVQRLLESVAAAASRAFGVPVEHCWVTFTPIPSGRFLEGGRVREAGEAEVSPLVSVLASQGPDLEKKANVLRAVAQAVAAELGIDPDGVFVEYREIPAHHALSGGKIR